MAGFSLVLDDTVKSLRICLAADESVRSGRAVTL
jgi:hypothetical protein